MLLDRLADHFLFIEVVKSSVSRLVIYHDGFVLFGDSLADLFKLIFGG